MEGRGKRGRGRGRKRSKERNREDGRYRRERKEGEGRGREGGERRDDAAGETKAYMTCLIPCCSLPHSPASACLQASHH